MTTEVDYIIKPIENAAENIITERTIFSCTFNNITPWWGGDYEGITSPHVDEDEIIGRTKWFLSTVYNRFLSYNLDSFEESFKWIGNILGSGDNGLSEYTIKTYEIDNENIAKYSEDECRDKSYLGGIYRVKVVTQEKINNKTKFYYNKCPFKQIKFKINLLKNKNTDINENNLDNLIISSLMLTLAYIGIGKGANRGFGRFYPEEECIYKVKDKQYVDDIKNKIIQGNIKEAFNDFYNYFENNFKRNIKEQGNKQVNKNNKLNQWNASRVPLAPLINEGKPEEKIRIINCNSSSDIENVLKNIERSVTKNNLFRNEVYKMMLYTWLLGLPRDREGIGYFINKTTENDNYIKPRRQSMLILTPIINENEEISIAILPFLSMIDHAEIAKKLVYKKNKEEQEKNKANKEKNDVKLINEINEIENIIKELITKHVNGSLIRLCNYNQQKQHKSNLKFNIEKGRKNKKGGDNFEQ